METIEVNLQQFSYSIRVGNGLVNNLPEYFTKINSGQQWVVITQPFLAEKYGQVLIRQLQAKGFRVDLIVVAEGESVKSLSQVEELYNQLLNLRCDRSTTLLALGGGVVGDLTGFVAATFMRGINYIQVPTTLLAMVDSAIGGKTGVNLPQGKNLVGSIYQPRAVFIDPQLLATLPPRQVISGLAEVMKYGAIRDREFFMELSTRLESLMDLSDQDLLQRAISRSCAIKAEVVVRDERESDLRRILNYGHTIGHGLEVLHGYGGLTHGVAVAYGMLAAGAIARKRGMLNTEDWELFQSTLKRFPLPRLKEFDESELLAIIRRDKKHKAGKLHFVLLDGLGRTKIVDDITDAEIIQSLEML